MTKSANGDWELKRTSPWHDDQMCVVNGYRCMYLGEWGDDAFVCLPGGGKAAVSTLKLFPERYAVSRPTMARTYN